jgi:anti-sigma factor RsiW
MRCRTAEKRLSDSLDRALSPRMRARLDAHLAKCPACRATRDTLLRLNEAAGPPAERSEEYWAGFERRLEARLDQEPAGRRAVGTPFPGRRRLAWAAAGFVLLAAVAAAWFAFLRPAPVLTAEWLPDADPLAPILLEAEADPEFERAVEGEIRVSLEALSPAPDADAAALSAADPLFWEALSDEELEAVVAGMERESGVGGPK